MAEPTKNIIYVLVEHTKNLATYVVAYDSLTAAKTSQNWYTMNAARAESRATYSILSLPLIRETKEEPQRMYPSEFDEIYHPARGFCCLCDKNFDPKIQLVIRIPPNNKIVCLECASKISELYDKDM